MRRARLLAAALLLSPSAANATDLIIHNARVTTLVDAAPDAQAIAIDDGKITAVGTDAAVLRLRTSGTRVVDAGRRRVIPGLNDSHSHYIRGGLGFNAELRWDGVPTLAQALARLREQAARTPEGQWVRVIGGWTPWQFAERRLPTRAELDAASPNRPVYLQYFYSKALLNTAGIKALGFTPATSAPPGTRLEKDARGALTGVLIADPHPALMYQSVAKLPALSIADQRNSSEVLFRTLAGYGLTSAVDAGGGGQDYPDDYDVAIALAKQGRLPLRIGFNLFAQRPGKELEDFTGWTAKAHAGQSFGAVDDVLELHGGGEYLVWSAADFENFQSPRPTIPTAARAQLKAVVQLMVFKRWPFSLHATYDETASLILDVIEEVNRETPLNGLRFTIDHAETIGDRSIARVKALGGGIAVQSRMVMLGDDFVARYGAAKAAQSPPVRKVLAAGVPLGLGTDAPRGSTFNPWVTLHWLVTGQTASGRVLYGADNRLTRLEALRAHTLGSAWFSGEEDRKGRLAVGQFADLAVLSADYFAVPDARIKSLGSVLTVVGGRIVHAGAPYTALGPAPIAPSPAWSPTAFYPSYTTSRR